ncbi:fimbrial protein [Andreprevotia chitinilytica]|uniref:fimbrial protein n=1 Tax=Andreprevotia chitinilytica TaxID=396808 RepID=UPI00055916F2|nr:fimbrial protein [Andreprevotia chitinilytica]
MNKKFALGAFAASTIVSLALTSGAAAASDGTITFTGKVTAATCKIDVNGSGAKDATVVLPTVTTTSLASGSVAGATKFDIKLTECATATSVRAFFENGTGVDNATGNLKNTATTAAANVQVQLTNASDVKIVPGDQAQRTAAAVTVTGNAATLSYGGRYAATGAAGAGDVTSSVTYSIDYI